MKKPKMTQEIEDEILNRWENLGWSRGKCEEYLLSLDFTKEEIDLMRERWSEGKSLYPYN